MADGCNFETHKMRYICSCSNDFDEIWYGNAYLISQIDGTRKI